MNRSLYLIAYDITDNKRLASARYFLKAYSTGGQKSVFECFLTDGEFKFVAGILKDIIEEEEDRVHILTMDGRSRTHALGIGVQPKDPAFFYIG